MMSQNQVSEPHFVKPGFLLYVYKIISTVSKYKARFGCASQAGPRERASALELFGLKFLPPVSNSFSSIDTTGLCIDAVEFIRKGNRGSFDEQLGQPPRQ